MSGLQVAAVFAGQILFWELQPQLVVSVELPLAPAQPGHLLCRELPHVLLHPRRGQAGGGPAVAAPLHHSAVVDNNNNNNITVRYHVSVRLCFTTAHMTVLYTN